MYSHARMYPGLNRCSVIMSTYLSERQCWKGKVVTPFSGGHIFFLFSSDLHGEGCFNKRNITSVNNKKATLAFDNYQPSFKQP